MPSSAMDSSLHLLSYELFVASIPKEHLPEVTHPLLRLLLQLLHSTSDYRQQHYFSFTETETDYSIILDKELLQILKPCSSECSGACHIEVGEDTWRALVVEVGALGSLTGISKIAASVISPLANCGVSVFCLSTNQDDYVMVKQCDLERALACLAKSFKLNFDLQTDATLVEAADKRHSQVASPLRTAQCSVVQSEPPRPVVHPYSCSSNQFTICSIVPTALPSIGALLLDLMLYKHRSSSEEPFLSLSVIGDDISMVVDCREVERFPQDSLYYSEGCWRMIRIGEGPLGFDECGIVAQVSAPLAQAEISTYYICTFNTDHTLVMEECVEKALRVLNERYVSKLTTTCATKEVKIKRKPNSILDNPSLYLSGLRT